MNKSWWLKLFFVVTAMMVGVWIPLRVLYFRNFHATDLLVDLITLSLVAAHYVYNYRAAKQSGDKFEPSALSIFTDILVALPMASLILPLAGVWSVYFLLFKLLNLKRILYIPELLDAFPSMHPLVYRLVPLFIMMPILIHNIACIWIDFGSGTVGPSGDNLTDYVKAVYWAVTTLTTVGYGDISAKTNLQMLFTCGVQLTGVGVFGFVLSNVAAVLARLDAAREHHLSALDRVETYMRVNHLSPALRTRVRSYYKYMWDNHRGYDDNEVLDTLPGKLHGDIAMELSQKIISQVPLLKGAEQDVIQDIVLQLKPVVSVPGEKIFHIDEPGDSMFFIHAGEIEIIVRDGSTVATLKPGSFFGEMALLTNQGRNATARAKTYCDLLVLSREAFFNVAHRYPSFERTVQETMASRLKSA